MNMKGQLNNYLKNHAVSASLVLVIIIFILSYTFTPLYSSNQNTYFLHGLENGGLGFLSNDWMANTADPFPLFSYLVKFTYSNIPGYFFQIYYSIILGVFIYSLMGLAAKIWRINNSTTEYFIFFILVAWICSPVVSALSHKLFGVSSGFFHAGLAGQYILGDIFQPSVFGVFLLLSVYAFITNRMFVSVLSLGIAANFHATYLLSAAMLTVSYMHLILVEERNYKKAFFVGVASFVLVVPTIIYAYLTFGTTSKEILWQAQDILVNYRIPHHAKVEHWLGISAYIQIGIIILALFVHRKTKIFWIIFIPFLLSFSLTAVQVITDSRFLALLFPWRITVVLVPLSIFLLCGWFVSFVFRRYKQKIWNFKKIINIFVMVMLFLLVVSGLTWTYFKHKYFTSNDSMAMMEFVSATKRKDDIFLIPTKLQQFRLQTGARTFIDKKTHPYKGSEVIEWYNRVSAANKFYTTNTDLNCDEMDGLLSKYHLTHIVVINEKNTVSCKKMVEVFNDGLYSIYKLE